MCFNEHFERYHYTPILFISRVAHEIVQANKLADRINITAKHSAALTVADANSSTDTESADLKSKVDLIITETIDCGEYKLCSILYYPQICRCAVRQLW